MTQPIKNVKEPKPIKSSLRVEPPFWSPELVVLVGFGVVVTLDGGGLDEDGLTLELVTTSPPRVLTGLHDEDGGAGCAGGVAGSPWWKVEPE